MRNQLCRPVLSLLLPLICLMLLCCPPRFGLAATAGDRPNVLFCIADDWSWPHAGALGDRVVRTPNIDRIAASGVVFTNAFCAAPSCTPSRAAMLTGRYPHELEQGGNLWSFLPAKFKVFPDLLESTGYAIGHTRKGWGPGNIQAGGRARNPAGPRFNSFDEFLERRPGGKPFFFWFGSQDPHRPYTKGAGKEAGLDPARVDVHKSWPDVREIREDILDYYFEVERFDREIGELVQALETKGLLENTVVIITSDNGMPFPRAKANVYDLGARMPLILSWPAKFKTGFRSEFVNLADLAPTILELAGQRPFSDMSARTFLPLLKGESQSGREHVFLERERHANVRKGDLSYPIRAIRTQEFLYIRNLRPDRWPAGDPEMHMAVGPYGDCDNSPSKAYLIENRENPEIVRFFSLAFAKRPAEELYHLPSDPAQTNNVVREPQYTVAKAKLARTLDAWMRETADPRVNAEVDSWSEYIYFGGPAPMPESERKAGR